MLSSSAETTGRPLDVRAIVDPSIDPLVPGGRELIALGRAAVSTRPDRTAFDSLVEAIGLEAAVEAVGVAANFEIMNRVVDATGLPVSKGSRATLGHLIDALGLSAFPHADH